MLLNESQRVLPIRPPSRLMNHASRLGVYFGELESAPQKLDYYKVKLVDIRILHRARLGRKRTYTGRHAQIKRVMRTTGLTTMVR